MGGVSEQRSQDSTYEPAVAWHAFALLGRTEIGSGGATPLHFRAVFAAGFFRDCTRSVQPSPFGAGHQPRGLEHRSILCQRAAGTLQHHAQGDPRNRLSGLLVGRVPAVLASRRSPVFARAPVADGTADAALEVTLSERVATESVLNFHALCNNIRDKTRCPLIQPSTFSTR